MEEGTYCKQKEKKREINSSLKKQRKINNCFSLVFFFFFFVIHLVDSVIFASYSWKNKALSQASLKNSKATMRARNFPGG
jgi:cell division septal protein FtsQ